MAIPLDITATGTNDGGSGKNATPANQDDDVDRPMTMTAVMADDDEDELFELDIALLDGRGDGHSAAAVADDDAGHALLANCLLPVRSVSNAVPVDASSMLSSSYPCSVCHSSRRLFFTGGISRRFLGRSSAGDSAMFSFSSRGFDTYFQRY